MGRGWIKQLTLLSLNRKVRFRFPVIVIVFVFRSLHASVDSTCVSCVQSVALAQHQYRKFCVFCGFRVRNFLLYLYTHEVAVKVVAIAVRMVITTLRILPQRVLLLNVPILFRLKVKDYRLVNRLGY